MKKIFTTLFLIGFLFCGINSIAQNNGEAERGSNNNNVDACGGVTTGITASPATSTVCVGASVTLSSSITGSCTGGAGCKSYKWYSAAAVGGPYSVIAGATSATYGATATAGTVYYEVTFSCNGGTTYTSTVVSVTGSGGVTNDNCASAISLGTVSTTTTTTGTNSCASADGTYSTCHAPTENVWYSFTVPAGGGTYNISVTGGTIVDPCLSLNSGACASTTEITCSYGSGSSSSIVGCLGAGTYLIAVDDDFGTEGTFSLTVTQTSAGLTLTNDNCAGAIALGTVSTTTTTTGNNNCATADGSYSGCHSPTDNVWYSFTIPAGGGVYGITVTGGTIVDPSLSLNSGTCGSMTEIGCVYGSSSSASYTTSCIAAGIYYIAVDDDFGTEGTFSLTVTQISSGIGLTNDVCASAISLGSVSTTTTTAGTNQCASPDQTSSSCFTFVSNVWYKFTVPAGGGTYKITVNCNTLYEPGVAVFMGTCGSFVSIGCNDYCSGSGTSTKVSVTTSCLAAGTYYISVDDDAAACSGTQGTFSLTVTQTSAGGPPTNDLCTSPVALTAGSTTAGTNVCASSYSDPVPDCYAHATTATVWYTFTPATSGTATFSFTPGTIAWPAMSVYTGSCGSFTEVGCVSATAISTIGSISIGCLTAGVTYYIMIDNNGHSGSATGTFSITTTFTASASGGPSNDCCTNPALVTTTDGTCFVYTTLNATYDQYEFGCFNNTTNSHNVWFSFVATGPNATINVTGGATFNPEVSIFTATNLCSVTGVSGIGCATATGSTVSVSNSQSLVAGQTYYVMVDNNQTGTPGSFSLCINNDVTPPSPGQDCKTALQVCNNSNLGGNASGTGSVTDLNGTNEGCLTGEHESNWFVVSINTGGTLTMTISAGAYDDYDYALWGPTNTCPIGAAPINCNYSGTTSSPTSNTGMTSTVTATTSQNAGGTPWNSPANVTTGSTYILLVDNYSASTQPFTLTWGGTAILSCNPVIILPVELINYIAALNGEEVDLKWSSASENNNAYFTIERSADGKNFEEFTRVNSAGNSTQKLDYSAVDYAPLPGISYYRLNQTDINGNTQHLGIKPITNINNDGMFTAIPNPTDGIVNITYLCNTATVGTLKLFDNNGALVLSKDFACTNGKNTSQLDLSGIASGIYLITFSTDTKFYHTKLMKR